MTLGGNESILGEEGFRAKFAANCARAFVWVLVAFGFLVVGLVGGTVAFAWKREWAWLVPVASFGGYLLAFRHALLLWNPAVDRTWRRYLWVEREVVTEEDPEKTLETLRPEAPRPPRHELRVVR